MLNFEKLILHNFGSYGDAEVDLRDRGFCLVTGRNQYKKDNALSNGSGKSFLWNAICFALVGETVNGLHSNLKNINVPEDPTCYVTLYFSENRDNYQITRHIAPKSDLKIIKNAVDVSGKGIRESEKKLTELLPNITKNLITSTIIIGQGMPNKFSSFSPSGRKELLERLTQADFMIEDIKQRVAGRLSVLSMRLRELEDAQLAKNSQLTLTSANYKQKQAQLQQYTRPDFDKQLQELAEVEQSLLTSINTAKVKYEKLILELSTQSEEALKISSAQSTMLDSIRLGYEQQAMGAMQTQAELKAATAALTAQIRQREAVVDVCPTCGQHIPGTKKPDTSGLREELSEKKAQLADIDAVCAQLRQSYDKQFNDIRTQYEQDLGAVQTLVEHLRVEASSTQGNVSTLEQSHNLTKQKIERLHYERQNWELRQQELAAEVRSLERSVTQLSNELNTLTIEVSELNARVQLVRKMDSLIKRDFRGFLLANIISYLDQKAKAYCSTVFGTTDLEIALDGNNLNISYCGKAFDNLSGGEKQRVDLILQFAIRNMLTEYLDFNSNILVLDEITDFLDKKSCQAILELITRELRTIESVFIVSHHATALALPIDSEMQILKNSHGISEIIL